MEARTFRFSFLKKYLETTHVFPLREKKFINIFEQKLETVATEA